MYRGYRGRCAAKKRSLAVHWAKSAVIKMRFLVGRKHRNLRKFKYQQQHYSVTKLQGEYRRDVAAKATYDQRTLHYQQQRSRRKELTTYNHEEYEILKSEETGAALLVQNFFRSEKRRLIDPFVRIRRRHKSALMLQTLFRGWQQVQEYRLKSGLMHRSASKIQIFYKSYNANMRWRGISRKIMQRCMEHLKKVKAMNLVLSNSRQNIELEQIRQNEAAEKVENVYKRFYSNKMHDRQLKEKRENLTKRIAMNEKIDDIHLRASALYKIKSFFKPSAFPPAEKTPLFGKLDATTKEELHRYETELQDTEDDLAEIISTNNMLRKETLKYHTMRHTIEEKNQTFLDRVKTYEVSLMDELQATSELYELHYNPMVREVNEMEENVTNILRISSSMYSQLNVMDPIDIRRLQLKSTNHIRHLLPFKFLNLQEFEQIIDSLEIKYCQTNDIICQEGDDGTLDPSTRNYYIIADGTCNVSKFNTVSGENIHLCELTKGDGFGEQQLIREDGKRTATVTATSKMMLFALHSKLFRSLISDRSWKVIQYELMKFDKKNKRFMIALNKKKIVEKKLTEKEKMELLKKELEAHALKKEKKKKTETNRFTRAESISIVVGALDEAMNRRAKAIESSPIAIVRRSIQEGLLLYQQKIWQTFETDMDEEAEERDEGGKRRQGAHQDQEHANAWHIMDNNEETSLSALQQTISMWTNALETGRTSLSSELLNNIETMSQTSLGSYGDGLEEEDISMLKVAEFELLHMNMGTMQHLHLFEEDLEEEFEAIEQQLWAELMEDEAYRTMKEEERPTPHDVLTNMLNEEATKVALNISAHAATSIQAFPEGSH